MLFHICLAVLLILAAGGGALVLLCRAEHQLLLPEFLGGSWLLGSGLVSGLLAVGGTFCAGRMLWLLVTLGCLSLGTIGRYSVGRRPVFTLGLSDAPTWERWFSFLALAPLGCILAATFRDALAWDGLLIWESKARAAFLSGGALPPGFFADASRLWTHPGYPLYLPFTELWIYLNVGDCHQGAAKVVLPLFSCAAVAVLWSGLLRLGSRPWAATLTALLFLGIPILNGFDWGLLHGYADLPLAALYLAGVVGVLHCGAAWNHSAWRAAAAAAAMLPWVKQEGIVLWACLVLLAALVAGHAHWRRAVVFALPGLLVWLAWRAAMQWAELAQEAVFLPLNAQTLLSGVGRLATISAFMRYELSLLEHWSSLWFLTLPALLCVFFSRRRQEACLLALAIGAPLLFDILPYMLTRLEPFQMHIATSFKRLALQVSLIALLSIGRALEWGKAKLQVPLP